MYDAKCITMALFNAYKQPDTGFYIVRLSKSNKLVKPHNNGVRGWVNHVGCTIRVVLKTHENKLYVFATNCSYEIADTTIMELYHRSFAEEAIKTLKGVYRFDYYSSYNC